MEKAEMKLWIPKCGDAALLVGDWTFSLQSEYRNNDLYDMLKGQKPSDKKYSRWYDSHGSNITVTFAVGTELVFDRIYIRQGKGMDDFASVTFIIKEHADEKLVGERFWVKLDQANKLDISPTTSDNPVGGFAKQRYKSKIKDRNDPTGAAKKVAKATQAKASKEELEAVREACRRECADPKSKHAQHVQDIIIAVAKHGKNKTPRPAFYSWTHIRECMTAPSYNGIPTVWCSTTGTEKCADGTKVRNMSFWFDNRHWGGFQVHVKDGAVTDVQVWSTNRPWPL